jgi:glycosyltransferase involved in cell wall biosynthesis
MKVIFINDSKFIENNGCFYSVNGNSLGIWNDFFTKNDTTWLARNASKKNNDKYNFDKMKSISGVNFVLLDDYMSKMTNVFRYKKTIKNIMLDADIVIISMPSILGIFSSIYGKKHKSKIIVNMVGDPYTAIKHSSRQKSIFALPITFFTKKIAKYSERVIYVSRNFLQLKYPTNGVSFYIPDIELNNVDDDVLKMRLSKYSNLSKNISIGLIGSLDVEYRGHMLLINSLKCLEKEFENYEFEIHFLGVGKKDRWEEIIKKTNLKSKFYFDGVLPSGEAVYNWMDRLDLLVMPTKQETMGRAIIEAMSRGLLVLGSRETAIHEQLGDDMLFYNNTNSICNTISKFLNNTKLFQLSAYENFYRAKKYNKEIIYKEINSFLDFK